MCTDHILDCNHNTVELTGSRNNHLVTSDKNDFLSCKEFLGDNGGQTTEKVVSAVDNFRLGKHHGFFVDDQLQDAMLPPRSPVPFVSVCWSEAHCATAVSGQTLLLRKRKEVRSKH